MKKKEDASNKKQEIKVRVMPDKEMRRVLKPHWEWYLKRMFEESRLFEWLKMEVRDAKRLAKRKG